MAVAAWKSKTKRNETRKKAKPGLGNSNPVGFLTCLAEKTKEKALWFTNNAVQSTISIGVFGISS
jgi:hypothetical protein